jgi:hypothetical protein
MSFPAIGENMAASSSKFGKMTYVDPEGYPISSIVKNSELFYCLFQATYFSFNVGAFLVMFSYGTLFHSDFISAVDPLLDY